MRITPCESWPRRFARTSSVAIHPASPAGTPRATKTSRVTCSSLAGSIVGIRGLRLGDLDHAAPRPLDPVGGGQPEGRGPRAGRGPDLREPHEVPTTEGREGNRAPGSGSPSGARPPCAFGGAGPGGSAQPATIGEPMPKIESEKPRLGISACLLGERVRYDGGDKRDPFLTATLGPFVEWVPVCPESRSASACPARRLGLDGYVLKRASPSCGAFRVLVYRSEEHTSELQSRLHLVCRLLL